MDATTMLRYLAQARRLINEPNTSLSTKTIAKLRAELGPLGDCVHFMAGWNASNPKIKLEDTDAETKAIADAVAADLERVLALLHVNTKPRRSGPGQPRKANYDLEYVPIVIALLQGGEEKNYALKKRVVEKCLESGQLKDRDRFVESIINGKKKLIRKSLTVEAHIKRIDRELKKRERNLSQKK